MSRIGLCSVLTPFVHGGAEILVDLLEAKLREHGHQVERVTLPFKWFPRQQILRDALAWRLLDLSGSYFQSVDQVICTKFPSYMVRHPNKSIWLFHQHREVYDFYGTPFSSFTGSREDQDIRQLVFELDNLAFGEASGLFTISRNVARRLERYNGVRGRVLYPPPKNQEKYRSGAYENFILSVSRLELNKRVELLVRTMALAPQGWKAIIVGQGPQREALETLTARLGLTDRVEFLGFVSEEDLLDLYSRARCVYFSPIDEDYGFITVEAMLSKRPVLTCPDSGGVLEFVEHGVSGLIAESPTPERVAELLPQLEGSERICQDLGEEGYRRVSRLNWDYVIERLVTPENTENPPSPLESEPGKSVGPL